MKTDAVALITILRSEKDSYQELLDLAQKEQELLIQGDTDRLSEVVRAIEQLLVRMRDLERQRITLVHDTTAGAPQPSEEHSLSSLITEFDAPAADEALTLRGELLALMHKLAEVNRTNTELIRRSMGYVDFLLGTLAGDDNPTYGNKSIPQSPNATLFDGRA